MQKKYLTYKLIDFLDDPEFISAVTSENPLSNKEWIKWLDDHSALKPVVEEAVIIIQQLQIKEETIPEGMENAIWNKIELVISEKKQIHKIEKKVNITRRLFVTTAIAASLALFLFFNLRNNELIIETEPGESLVYMLPDASTVELNADSRISFSEEDFINDRRIKIEGEAFFEVKKGGPFEITTERGTVEVLGTSFNVNTWNNKLEVYVYSGKVKVTNRENSSEHLLLPGDKIRISNTNQITEGKFEIQEQDGWRNGYYSFENAELDEVFQTIERAFDVKIEFDQKFKNLKVNNVFTSENLDSALNRICWPMNFQYKQNGSKITIYSEE